MQDHLDGRLSAAWNHVAAVLSGVLRHRFRWRRGARYIGAGNSQRRGRALRLLMASACLAIVAGTAGCASTKIAASASPAAIGRPVVASMGMILSMRLVPAQANPPAWRAVLLADASAANTVNVSSVNDSGKSTTAPMPVMEFIVRADDGSVISIVQVNDAGYHVGDRVIIPRGDPARLARPG
jgi:outer membrane lipoprotein SlyB